MDCGRSTKLGLKCHHFDHINTDSAPPIHISEALSYPLLHLAAGASPSQCKHRLAWMDAGIPGPGRAVGLIDVWLSYYYDMLRRDVGMGNYIRAS